MSQEEVFMQQWGFGPSEPDFSMLTDPEDSSSHENFLGYQEFARSKEFPGLVRYNLLALQSLPEAERQDVAAKAGITSLMPTMPVLDIHGNQVLLDSQVGENDAPATEATGWDEFNEFTHELGISPLPSNSEVNPPKPQPVETTSYPTPQSVPSPEVGTNTLGSDFSTPTDLDAFQSLDVPRPAHLYPTQTFGYTPRPATDPEGSTLHNTPENMNGIGMGPPLAEPVAFISQAAEKSSPHMVDDPTEENQFYSHSLSLEALQHVQAPEAMPMDHTQNMILLFPDLSINNLRQSMELGDRLFPQDLARLETQVNHWQAERLWDFVDFAASSGSSSRQRIAGICRHIKTMGNPNADNYMRIRLAKVQVNMLYETICKEEQDRRLNLGQRKFTTHVLNCIEAAISNAGGRRLPIPRKSRVRDSIFRYKRVAKKWLVSQGLSMTLLVDQDCGRIIENGRFTEMQMEALMFHVSATRPDIISLCSKLEPAVGYFLVHDQLPARPTLDDVRKMIGIHNSMTAIVD